MVAGCGIDPSVEEVPVEVRAKAPEPIWIDLAARLERTFIVALPPTVTDSATRADHKARLLAVAPGELVLDRDWSELPLVQVRATTLEAAFAVLERDEAAAAYEVEHYELTDAQSFPLIEQPAAAAAGKTGTGTTVAVLDTGADYTRAELGSCSSPGVPAGCKVAFAKDFAPTDNTLDDNGHGTNVSGIVVGVAPGTKVLALDVFNGASASSTHIISAINWVIANKATYNIASMNLSLGGGSSTTTCAADAMGIALGVARSAGIAPVVASGNSATTNAISSPACAPAAISVGAVYDANVGGLSFSTCSDPTTAADRVTCFSNSASFLTVLAPGAMITAAGYTMAGTSQAAPHVAGAFAVLHSAFPAESVDQQLVRLTSTGAPVLDPRNGITKPRINLVAALGASDTSPPTGTLVINGGAATTRLLAVNLALAATDDTLVAQMCVSTSTTCTGFVPYLGAISYTLAAGDGMQTLRVWYRDAAGNTSLPVAASIRVDTTAPTGGVLTVSAATARLDLSWTTATDAGSGFASYRLVGIAGTTLPATACTSGTTLYTGTATSFVHAVASKATWSYRLCAIDVAGNTATGSTRTLTAGAATWSSSPWFAPSR